MSEKLIYDKWLSYLAFYCQPYAVCIYGKNAKNFCSSFEITKIKLESLVAPAENILKGLGMV